MARRIGSAAVIVDGEGRVLLVKQNYGRFNWELPGGISEDDESAEDTVLRELIEETGLRVAIEHLSGVYYEHDGDYHQFVFVCRLTDRTAAEPDGDEVTACEYWHSSSLPRPISDFTIRRIEDALTGSPPTRVTTITPRRWIE